VARSIPTPRKQRTRQHVMADQSLNYVERFIIDAGHTAQRLTQDYGYDLILFTYDERGYAEPGAAFLQLKASDPKSEASHYNGGQVMREVTYAQLHKVLSSLSFSIRVVTVENKLRVYEHAGTGARLALAFRPEDDVVLPHHMAALEGTLRVHGIADPLDFAMQLQKAS
jgi:hypothetical protein